MSEPGRRPQANREYHPAGYDKWFGAGQAAARAGLPRVPPREEDYGFSYAYPALCWYDGYDSVEKKDPHAPIQ